MQLNEGEDAEQVVSAFKLARAPREKKQPTETTRPTVINSADAFAILSQVRYSPRRKIQSLFVLATFVLFDTIRRDRQIVNRRQSDR
jgi:hypothetical protein